MARQIAQIAHEFELRRTGHGPQSVSVALTGNTLVIALHGTLSPAETALAGTPEGSARLQEFHHQLFLSSSEPLRREIERVTGVAVCGAAAAVQPVTGNAVHVFLAGTTVQVFLLASDVPADTWSGAAPGPES